jgi:hypothetical protein
MSLPLGGSNALLPTIDPNTGDLARVSPGTPHSNFLVPSAGVGDEKSDQFMRAKPLPLPIDEDALPKHDNINANSWWKPNLHEIEHPAGSPAFSNAFSNWYQPTITLPEPLQNEVQDLDKRMADERKSFVLAAEKRMGVQPIEKTPPPVPGAKSDASSAKVEIDKKPLEPEKSPENPDALTPNLAQIEYNPNVQSEKNLENKILTNTLPAPYLTTSTPSTGHHGRVFTLLTGEKSND